MPKEEWGVKRVCPKTGKRFYDLNRNPIVSPYTDEVVELHTGNRPRTMVAKKAKTEPGDGLVGDVVVLDDDDAADVKPEDDLLDDDDDDSVSLDDIADVPGDDEED